LDRLSEVKERGFREGKERGFREGRDWTG